MAGDPARGGLRSVGRSEQAILRLPALARSAPAARAAVRDWCERRGAQDRVDRVVFAVTEAVANTVLHAYPDRADGEILVRFRVTGEDAFEVSVRDYGVGMRGRRPGGRHLGISVIQNLADSAEIADAAPGTVVVMRFGGESRPAPTPGPERLPE